MEGSTVSPGDVVGSLGEFLPGVGVFSDDEGSIRATLLGTVQVEAKSATLTKPRLNVVSNQGKSVAKDFVLRVGDTVLARVLRTNYNQAYVEIMTIGDNELVSPIKAVIRREDIRETEIDKVVVQEFFKPFDVVRAAVVSLGDSKNYFLSTAKTGLGVVIPRSQPKEI